MMCYNFWRVVCYIIFFSSVIFVSVIGAMLVCFCLFVGGGRGRGTGGGGREGGGRDKE